MPIRSIATVRNGKPTALKSALSGVWRDQETLNYGALPLLFKTDEHRVLGSYAERSVAVYACVAARANNLRTVPLRFWRQDGKIRRPVESGPLVQAWKKVNPFWSGVRFMDAIEQSLCYYGNAYFVVDKTNKKQPEFWWVHPGKIKPIRGKNYIDGYRFEDFETGQRMLFRPDEVVHIPYFFVENEWEGLSPLTAARNGIEAAIDAMHANRKFFKNGMHIAGIVSPKEDGERFTKQQVKELELDLAERFNGSSAAHRLAILSGAVDVTPWGVAPKDAEFMNLAQWTLADVCRVYSTPLSIVQEVERSAYKNIGTEMKGFWTLCLVPEGKFIASELTEKLLPLFSDEADSAEFDFSGIPELQADQTEVVLQMKVLAESLRVPPNVLIQHYMPHLIPEGTDGFPWGDEPLAIPGLTGLGNANGQLDALADPDQRSEAIRTLLAHWTPNPIEPTWRETPKGQAYLKALEAPKEPKSIAELLLDAKTFLAEIKADDDIPAFGSDAHEAIMAATEASLAPLEQQARLDLTAFFAEQATDMIGRFEAMTLPTKAAGDSSQDAFVSQIPQSEEQDDNDAWLLLALVLLHRAYPAGDWAIWDSRLRSRLLPIISAAGNLGAENAARDMGITLDRNARVLLEAHMDAWGQNRSAFSSQAVNATTWDQVKQTVADSLKAGETIEEIVSAIRERMEIRAVDASAIASTEVFTAHSEGMVRTYETTPGVTGIAWLTRLDKKVRDAHRRLHGQTIKPGERFTIPSGTYQGYKARGPGQFGVRALDFRCRCRPFPLKEAPKSHAPGNGNGKVATL